MPRLFWRLAALLLAAGCSTLQAPSWQNQPEAAALVEAWLRRSQGFDALEAWEMLGSSPAVRFAIARKWSGEQVKVLAYVVAPARLKDAAYLSHLAPDRAPDVWVRAPASVRGGRTQARVSHLPGSARNPASAATIDVGAEVGQPFLHGSYAYRRVADQVIGDEPCAVVESRPLGPGRARFSRLVYWIGQRSGIALRRSYYRGERELRRVEIRPEDVVVGPDQLHVGRLRVRTGDRVVELSLVNSVAGVELPDSLFTEHTLETRRFPRF